MAGNNRLKQSKNEKFDEFYTQYSDIEEEVSHYAEQLRGKTVYCNCDNPEISNFWKYFCDKYKEFGLNKLIATYINSDEDDIAYCYEYDGNSIKQKPLLGNGGFETPECKTILKNADIIITNPPFSMFREYMDLLIENNKKFLILGNINAIGYASIRQKFIENEIKIGYNTGGRWYIVPSRYNVPAVNKMKIENGKIYCRIGSTAWFTNMNTDRTYDDFIATERFNIEKNRVYQNYPAFNVSSIAEIPKNEDIILELDNEEVFKYRDKGFDLEVLESIDGKSTVKINRPVFGVPITFMLNYNPEQFEVVRIRKGNDDKDLQIDGKDNAEFTRVLIRYKKCDR